MIGSVPAVAFETVVGTTVGICDVEIETNAVETIVDTTVTIRRHDRHDGDGGGGQHIVDRTITIRGVEIAMTVVKTVVNTIVSARCGRAR